MCGDGYGFVRMGFHCFFNGLSKSRAGLMCRFIAKDQVVGACKKGFYCGVPCFLGDKGDAFAVVFVKVGCGGVRRRVDPFDVLWVLRL